MYYVQKYFSLPTILQKFINISFFKHNRLQNNDYFLLGSLKKIFQMIKHIPIAKCILFLEDFETLKQKSKTVI